LQQHVVVQRGFLGPRDASAPGIFFGDVVRHVRAVNGAVLVLPVVIPGVLVEIRVDGRAVRPGRDGLEVPERGGIEVLEVVGQALAHGRRDAYFFQR
jgi:hypothetical protein